MNERIPKLIDEYLAMAASDKNKARRALWHDSQTVPGYQLRANPAPLAAGNGYVMPFRIHLMNSAWSRLLRFSLKGFYTDPEVYLEHYLSACLMHFKMFDDDTYFPPAVGLWFGPAFELSFFGVKTAFRDDQDAWIDHEPVLSDLSAVDSLPVPSFYESGLMPLAHRMYERLVKLTGGKLKVEFPDWIRGPFATAVNLRGFEPLLVDIITNPEGVVKLLEFVTNVRKEWVKERARFLGEEVQVGSLFNDEVGCPTLSPALYHKYVLPFEKDLAEFFGGISYWHSCSDTTELMAEINQIPGLRMVHVSPWSDLATALDVYKDKEVEICVNPVDDVQLADEEHMEAVIRRIVSECRKHRACATLRADAIQLLDPVDTSLDRCRQWVRLAREITMADEM